MPIKKPIKHGNSAVLVIDQAILELLNIDMDTLLEITTDGNVLIMVPVKDQERRRRFDEALAQIEQEVWLYAEGAVRIVR